MDSDIITNQVYHELSIINSNWSALFKQLSTFEYYHQFIEYIINMYTNNPTTIPKLENIFNPFKYTDPYTVLAVIISNTCEKDSLGLAYSSSKLSKTTETISNELTKEYSLILGHDVVIQDPSFRKLATQGVFMPNINLFYGMNDNTSPDYVKLFWNDVLKYLSKLGCIIWFAWGSDVEQIINKVLNISEESLDKKKPDEKAIVSTNPKIKDNKPLSPSFKGLGCFNICNRYLSQYHRKTINWINI